MTKQTKAAEKKWTSRARRWATRRLILEAQRARRQIGRALEMAEAEYKAQKLLVIRAEINRRLAKV